MALNVDLNDDMDIMDDNFIDADEHREFEVKSGHITEDEYNDSIKYSEYARKIGTNSYLQMKCNQYQLIYNPFWVKCVYIILGLICIPLGFITYNLSDTIVHEETIKYNEKPECNINSYDIDSNWGKQCIISHKFKRKIKDPLYLHYKIHNFYQNQLTYLQSRSPKQYRNVAPLNVRNCKNAQDYKGLLLLPCGLIASSFFNGNIILIYQYIILVFLIYITIYYNII